MTKKLFLPVFALIASVRVMAQGIDTPVYDVLDYEEDTVNVTSLDDIIKTQEQVYSESFRSEFVKTVWKRKKAFTVSYNNTTMKSEKLYMYNESRKEYEQENAEFKSDWGLNIKRSRNAAFHKHPIGDVLLFGLEWSLLDLSVNHFKKNEGTKLYDSNATFTYKDDDDDDDTKTASYMPWGSEMYTFAYGVKLGPSITVAPFARMRNRGLAHIRLQGYFNMGYRGGLLWLRANEKDDANYENRNISTNTSATQAYENVNNSIKLNWGHGLTTSWGIRLNWKAIGVGYEVIRGNLDFKSVESNVFGSGKTKFSETNKRICISYIW